MDRLTAIVSALVSGFDLFRDPAHFHSSMGIISGPLFDRGYFHYQLAVGSLIYTLCTFMISL